MPGSQLVHSYHLGRLHHNAFANTAVCARLYHGTVSKVWLGAELSLHTLLPLGCRLPNSAMGEHGAYKCMNIQVVHISLIYIATYLHVELAIALLKSAQITV